MGRDHQRGRNGACMDCIKARAAREHSTCEACGHEVDPDWGHDAETAGQCGAWSGCPLPRGHNMGNADVPENHALHEEPAQCSVLALPGTRDVCSECSPHPFHGRYACRRNGDLCPCGGGTREAVAEGHSSGGTGHDVMNAEQQGAYIAGKLNAAIDTIAHDVVAKLVRDGVGDEWENYPEVGMDDWHAVVKRALEIVGQVDPDPDQFRAAYDYLTERAEK